MPTHKTIIVSNRLPVRIEKDGDKLTYKSSEGGLATALGSIYKDGDNIWVGWPGAAFESDALKAEVTEGLKKESMRPVFLTEEDLEKYYLGFSNQTLWPAFHYFLQYIDYGSENWDSYVEVNQKFADAIAQYTNNGDTLWVHDYQLLLLPAMLRKKFPDISIGFFQHIPFPSYEVFRTLPRRRELLEGMLGADYLGFHTYDDMRHFLSSAHRLAGYPYSGNRIILENRTVVADPLPMGIDYEKYEENASHPEAVERENRYRKSLGSQRLILSMDRLDYSKGIPRRLRAFDALLERYPEYREKVSLLLVVVPSRDQVPNYQSLKEQVDELVGKINSKYGRMSWVPIHYFYRSYPFRALGAFYRMCDVAAITPVRDGMNLVAKEYIASRKNQDGVLILSEMAGAAKELSDAILVNPNDKNQLVEAMHRALTMPKEEQKLHMSIMQETVRKYNIYNWVKLFFDNLKAVKKMQTTMSTTPLTAEGQNELISKYKSAARRLLLLDYDGTLVNFKNDPLACAPDDELMDIIRGLSTHNDVVIISGRNHEILDEWLGSLSVHLVAEHGVWSRTAGEEWKMNSAANAQTWHNEAREIMDFYVDRTPGTFIEKKSNSLVWHYRKAEKGLGEMRKSELTSHLKHMLGERGFQVMDGDHVVELKPESVNKGRAAEKWQETTNADFTLCLGDDTTDEDMFSALPENAFTVKVGPGSSHARFAVENVKAVRKLLSELIDV
ncbi:MAG: bifunctional alpha,alpha-trehalose-phosphate synthase (UDP-forming)/trehalose-phosphatase [Cryomorphaceae bacterium]|nr:bifunctional alpha,alpha-trehalose-phosphate synthase (UDP-forming)/trehalose-phosphatase [Flavobacteriales bacterium]